MVIIKRAALTGMEALDEALSNGPFRSIEKEAVL